MPKEISIDTMADNARTPGGEMDDRMLEQEYLDAEKGKMNTLQVIGFFHFVMFQFCINLMKGIAGTGSLAIPSAFKAV